jgi:hypothetical protein
MDTEVRAKGGQMPSMRSRTAVVLAALVLVPAAATLVLPAGSADADGAAPPCWLVVPTLFVCCTRYTSMGPRVLRSTIL